MTRVLIIGAGKIGSVVASLLQVNKDVVVSFWDKDKTRVPNQGVLSELVTAVDVVFLCINSWAHRETLENICSYLKEDAIVVSLAKGIESGSNKTIAEVIAEYLSPTRFGLLSGPMLADELASGAVGAAVIGSRSPAVQLSVLNLFASSFLLVESSDDTAGVALCGVLKNVYAIVLGMCDGLELGCNAQGILIQQILSEMSALVGAHGGMSATAYSYAGIGDMIATGMSPYSNNYIFGKEYALKGKSEHSCEGDSSFPSLISLLSGVHAYPLLVALEHILIHYQPVHESLTAFFKDKKEREALSCS